MNKKNNLLWNIETGLCLISLLFLVALPVAEVVARKVFSTGVPSSQILAVHFLLVLGIVSGMITTKSREHLSISLIQFMKDGPFKQFCQVLSGCLSAFVLSLVAFTAPSFIRVALGDRLIGFIPERVFALILPIGYLVMAVRFARMTPLKGGLRIIPWVSLLLGAVAAFPALAKFIWGLDISDSVYYTIDEYNNLASMFKYPIILLLVFAGLTGTPLFVVIGALALLLLQANWGEMDTVIGTIYSGLTNNSITAIPLFTIAGFFLSESRAGERLVVTFRSIFSWIPGGLVIVTVIICAFFTSFTGASGVTILALGGILYSILSEHSAYPQKFSIGLLTSVGSIGLLFPPSLPIILVGTATQTNIIHMFVGGIIPGIILIVTVAIFGIISSIRVKIPVTPFDGKHALRSLKNSFLEILLPIVLIAGYFSGTFSLVEIGAIAVVYVFIAEVLVNKEIKMQEVPRVLLKGIPIIGGVLSILAMSQGLSFYIVDTQAPVALAEWMQQAIQSKYVFLLLLNLSLLVVGCLMDIFSAILIILPLVAPLAAAYGVNPVHLGIIFITNLEVGFLTPPVGMNLFLATYRFKKSFVEICRDVFPFLLIQLVVVILVTYIPFLSTCLIPFFKF